MLYRQLEPDITLFDTAESVVDAVFKNFPAVEAEVPGVDIMQE